MELQETKEERETEKNSQNMLNSVTFEQNADWQAHTGRTVIIVQIMFNKSKPHFFLLLLFNGP